MAKIYTVSDYEQKPMIRLRGSWLAKHGFNIGDKLEFIESKNMIILTKLPKDKTNQLKRDFEIRQLQQKINDLI